MEGNLYAPGINSAFAHAGWAGACLRTGRRADLTMLCNSGRLIARRDGIRQRSLLVALFIKVQAAMRADRVVGAQSSAAAGAHQLKLGATGSAD